MYARPPHRVQEGHSIMTFVLSRNGRHALLNIATQVQYMCTCYMYMYMPRV